MSTYADLNTIQTPAAGLTLLHAWGNQIRENFNAFLAILSAGCIGVRQGGDPSNWSNSGSNSYAPGNVLIQCGQVGIVTAGASSGTVTITFPTPFSNKPIIIASKSLGAVGIVVIDFGWSGPTTTQVAFAIKYSGITTDTAVVDWIAIGPA